eukprot:SAG22_NODE_3365_length_1757_cov_1.211098_2_plen_283_part_01
MALRTGLRELQGRLVVALGSEAADALLSGQTFLAGLALVDETALRPDDSGGPGSFLLSKAASSIGAGIGGAVATGTSWFSSAPAAPTPAEALARGDAPPPRSACSATAAGGGGEEDVAERELRELKMRVAELHAELFGPLQGRAATTLPVLPWLTCVGLVPETIRRMKSKTRPFMVDCLCHAEAAAATAVLPPQPQPTRLMVKQNDDLRKDQVAQEAVALCQSILDGELPGEPLPVVGYRVLASGIDSGVMEVVCGAKTVFDITLKYDALGNASHSPSALMRY